MSELANLKEVLRVTSRVLGDNPADLAVAGRECLVNSVAERLRTQLRHYKGFDWWRSDVMSAPALKHMIAEAVKDDDLDKALLFLSILISREEKA